MPGSKPQVVAFGSQPAKNPEVQYGVTPAASETVPDAQSGIVPRFAHGSPVPYAHLDDHAPVASDTDAE